MLEKLALFGVVEERLKGATAKANQFDLAVDYAQSGEGGGGGGARGRRGASLDTAVGIVNR